VAVSLKCVLFSFCLDIGRASKFLKYNSSKISPFYARIFFTSLGQLSLELASFSNCEQAIRWLKEA
jgi:hypothetical protein